MNCYSVCPLAHGTFLPLVTPWHFFSFGSRTPQPSVRWALTTLFHGRRGVYPYAAANDRTLDNYGTHSSFAR